MANLSRTEKYKELRDSLHNDTDADIGTKELSGFESRLNRIDSNNFRAPQNYLNDDHDAAHAKNRVYDDSLTEEVQEENEPVFDTSILGRNENYTSNFDNDFLDQYIREVKEYNREQGYAVSDKTSVNVLNAMNSGSRQRGSGTPLTPYPDNGRKQQAYNDTADIPFVSQRRNVEPQASRNPIQDEYRAFDEPMSRTKEDIMAEVQNMVNGTRSAQIPNINMSARENSSTSSIGTDTFSRRMDEEKNAREQLMNETTQMRAQLDDYEDNLSEISDKMRHTNRILNIVLVVLIVALSVVLIFIIYWNIIARGGIS